MKKILEMLFLLTCAMGIILGVWNVVQAVSSYKKGEAEYAELTQYFAVNTNSEAELPYTIDFDALAKINPDVVGWVVIEGTEINYPILQGKDNSTYLKKTYFGNKNSCGAIFMDAGNTPDFSDLNTVIYGHNMRNGSMFRALNNYADAAYYKEHSTVWICTKDWQRKYAVISAHTTKSASSTYNISFSNHTEYETQLINEVQASLYATGNTYDLQKNMIVLSTCRGRGSEQRFVLILQPEMEIHS